MGEVPPGQCTVCGPRGLHDREDYSVGSHHLGFQRTPRRIPGESLAETLEAVPLPETVPDGAEASKQCGSCGRCVLAPFT